MFKTCLLVCFVGYFVITETNAAIASFIKPCKPDDKACIVASTSAAVPFLAKGMPEHGIPSAEPLILHDVRADGPSLKLGFRNLQVIGVSKCKVIDMTRDLQKSTMTLTVDCPLRAIGQYDLDGKLFILSAQGDGDFEIKTDRARISATIKIKDTETGGKKYWKVTGFDYSYKLVEKVHIKLENLFGGDTQRSKPIEELLEKSANDLVPEIGEPIIKELISRAVDIVKQFFKIVPVNELEIN